MPRLARRLPFVFALLSFFVALLLARLARADGPAGAPLYVLDIQSDGTADDQAKALTTAIRSRVRASPDWQLKDADHSFETFRLTLKCPIGQKPDAACLERIADHIQEGTAKADRYVWGEMAHKGANEVTVTVHMWQRGKPDVSASETYSDNLKDENDEALRTIAERLVSKLTGSKQTGSITVHAGNAAGVVLVDGVQKATLDAGVAKVEAPTGPHTIEVRVEGYAPSTQQVTLAAGGEQDLTFTLTPAKAEPPTQVEVSPSKLPVRKILAWSAIGLGVVSLGIGTYEGIRFLSIKSDLDNDRNNVSNTVTNVCDDLASTASIDACNKVHDGRTARNLEIGFLAAGAVLVGGGVALLVTDKGTSDDKPKAGTRVLPHVGRNGVGVDLAVTF